MICLPLVVLFLAGAYLNFRIIVIAFLKGYMIYSSNDNLYLDETSCQMGLTGACHIDHWDIPYTMCRLGCTWTKCGSAQPCCWILATVTDPLNSSIETYSLLVWNQDKLTKCDRPNTNPSQYSTTWGHHQHQPKRGYIQRQLAQSGMLSIYFSLHHPIISHFLLALPSGSQT